MEILRVTQQAGMSSSPYFFIIFDAIHNNWSISLDFSKNKLLKNSSCLINLVFLNILGEIFNSEYGLINFKLENLHWIIVYLFLVSNLTIED